MEYQNSNPRQQVQGNETKKNQIKNNGINKSTQGLIQQDDVT